MTFQEKMDQMSKDWYTERSNSQMTLGELISKLEVMDENLELDGICEPHSYRGYYSDLSFEKSGSKVKVKDLLKTCKETLNQTFTGYKGGDYVMGKDSPLWLADYGCTGDKIMSYTPEGELITEKDEY